MSLLVIVDSNEAAHHPLTVALLRLSGLVVEVRPLEVCDYLASDRVGVERKAAPDFLASIKDGRLFEQARHMSHAYERPILVLEGDLAQALRGSQMKLSSVFGALASIMLDHGLAVVPTSGPVFTAHLLHRLAHREQTEGRGSPSPRHVDRGLPLHRQQVQFLEGLPHIGPTLAHQLLTEYGSPWDALRGLHDEVRSPGVGPKTLQDICDLLDTPYAPPDSAEDNSNKLRMVYQKR